MDTEPEIARDAGPLNVREAHAALDLHIARAIKRGDDGCAADLAAIGDVITQLVEQQDALASQLATLAGSALGLADLEGVARQIRSGMEALGKVPQ